MFWWIVKVNNFTCCYPGLNAWNQEASKMKAKRERGGPECTAMPYQCISNSESRYVRQYFPVISERHPEGISANIFRSYDTFLFKGMYTKFGPVSANAPGLKCNQCRGT